ncbi:MAG TPA: pyridoxamine 5'-phosphate oxidase family protein [Dehalococcoidia bacterium]|nr:pyridoxamine 5'-phosphate oxidase family protein [Dehalococcoidia bacterium]
MIGSLSTADAHAVLRQERIGRLGVWDGRRVFIYPVNYGFDGEALYLQSREGEKVRILREHPEVCVQVDQVITPARWRSVIVHGEFEEIRDERERDDALAAILRQGGAQPPSVAPYLDGPEHLVVYRVQIRELTGRYEESAVLQVHTAGRHHD